MSPVLEAELVRRMSSVTDNIRVVIRARPLPSPDLAAGASSVIHMQEKSCVVDGGGVGERRFAFDRCFWSADRNDAAFGRYAMK